MIFAEQSRQQKGRGNANDDGGFIISHQDCRILKVPKFEGGDDSGSIEVSIYVPTMVFRD